MSAKSKSLRAFVSSCETRKEEAKPALVPKLISGAASAR